MICILQSYVQVLNTTKSYRYILSYLGPRGTSVPHFTGPRLQYQVCVVHVYCTTTTCSMYFDTSWVTGTTISVAYKKIMWYYSMWYLVFPHYMLSRNLQAAAGRGSKMFWWWRHSLHLLFINNSHHLEKASWSSSLETACCSSLQ